MGHRADAPRRQGLAPLGARCPRDLLGRARLALRLPWPQRPAGLVETAFEELGRRWRPILDAFDEAGVRRGYEIHPGEDIHDGATFERFVDAVGGHARACINYDPSHFLLQQLDYVAFIDLYHERIKAFHVKDAEFNPTGASASTAATNLGEPRRPLPLAGRRAGGFRRDLLQARPVRLRFLGRARMGMRPQAPGGRGPRGAAFIRDHIIRRTEKAFDDFAGGGTDEAANRRMLGIEPPGSRRAAE
jgi:hypothetical protein